MQPLNIAVVGFGLIGKDHIRLIQNDPACQVAAIVDPDEAAQSYASEREIDYFPSLTELLQHRKADGIILATPNHLHAEQAQQCITAGIPALIEKPVTHTLEEGKFLLERVAASNTPMLVGHHRMHSPIMQTARKVVDSGVLGDLVAVNGSALFYKPDDYFLAGPWRTKLGGGPILINMIHEIGNLRYLCGEVTSVQAASSSARRGYAVEDTVGILLTFASGVVGTFILSDTAASACSWEQTAQENPDYASYPDQDCYHLAGSRGSLSIPTMQLKHYGTHKPSWYEPFDNESIEWQRHDPLAEQLNHFSQVIRGEVDPLVSVHDGLQNLRVTEAISMAARSGGCVQLG